VKPFIDRSWETTFRVRSSPPPPNWHRRPRTPGYILLPAELMNQRFHRPASAWSSPVTGIGSVSRLEVSASITRQTA